MRLEQIVKVGLDQVGITNENIYTIDKALDEAALIEEKKSKFICRLYHVDTEKAAMRIINKVKERFGDASHNCYAYIIMSQGSWLKRFSDDNEPNGTAGMPILRALESKRMCNVLAVVTRYFGGTLLGAGKLARTYKKAVICGLGNADTVRIKQTMEIFVKANYHDFNMIEKKLRELGVTLLDKNYGALVTARLLVEKQQLDKALFTIHDMTNGRAEIRSG